MKAVAFKILTLITIGILPSIAHTQSLSVGQAKISGSIVDAATGLPIEFATIALIDSKTKKTVNGNVADAKGEFVIDQISVGNYAVATSFIGYESITIDSVIVQEKKSAIKLGTIKLINTAKQLDEVVVQGQRALIEEKVDRTIYNAEQDKSSRGGDATDVLNPNSAQLGSLFQFF